MPLNSQLSGHNSSSFIKMNGSVFNEQLILRCYFAFSFEIDCLIKIFYDAYLLSYFN